MSETSQSVPVVSIVGTTSSGKTELAFAVAHEVLLSDAVTGVDIISADSRQIYQDVEVLTGADIPSEFSRIHDETVSPYDFFERDKIRLFGVSMLDLDQEWSVAQYQRYAQDVMQQSFKLDRAVIIVGGTGLFHKQLFNSDPRLQVAPNDEIREKTVEMSAEELQQWLSIVDPAKLEQMNDSDRQNPRRLVRAIEIASAGVQAEGSKPFDFDVQHSLIGLQLPEDVLKEKVTQRVHHRLAAARGEVAEALALGELAPMIETILGFAQLVALQKNEVTQDIAIEDWVQAELQYAKRQVTWWKAVPEVEWFDAQDSSARNDAVQRATSLLLHGVAR